MSFISYLVNGLSLGSVYALIALGYTMVYGIAKMLNFAHGDVIMIRCICSFDHNEAGRTSYLGGNPDFNYCLYSTWCSDGACGV